MHIKRQKFILPTLVILCASACLKKTEPVTDQPLPEGPLSIVVTVEGVKCCDGVLRLALYNKSANWMSNTNMVRGRLGFIQGTAQTFEIHGLVASQYAIAVYQDKDSDNKLDRWFGLIPKEPYGFSNNVGQYGPASFKQAAFDLAEDKAITIKLNAW